MHKEFYNKVAEILASENVIPDGKYGVYKGKKIHFSWLTAAVGLRMLGLFPTLHEALSFMGVGVDFDARDKFSFSDPEMRTDPVADRNALKSWYFYKSRCNAK